jgi:hypothetical protein
VSVTLPPAQNVVEPLGVIVADGRAFTVTLAFALPLQPFAAVIVRPSDTGPLVEVKVMAFVPAPAVIVPPLIVQLYVAPLTAAVDALPLAPLQIALGAVIAGAGLVLIETTVSAEVALHPFESVTAT